MPFIKNYSYYDAKPYLKLERYPYYQSGGKKGTICNKVHLNLGFVKLVSRVCVEKANFKLLKQIAKEIGLEYKEYTIDPETGDCAYFDTEGEYTPCVLNKEGKWCSLDELWMCYKRGWKLVDHGLAEIWENGKHTGYYGFSHRGGCSARIGDKIFDPDWIMDEFHPDFKKYKKKLNRSKFSSRIEEVIPYSERGSISIETLEQAKVCATGISRELS